MTIFIWIHGVKDLLRICRSIFSYLRCCLRYWGAGRGCLVALYKAGYGVFPACAESTVHISRRALRRYTLRSDSDAYVRLRTRLTAYRMLGRYNPRIASTSS